MRVISTMCIHMFIANVLVLFIANVLVFKGIYVTHLEEGGGGSYGWRRCVSKGWWRCAITGVGSILPSQINVVPLCQQSPKRKCGWVAETNSLLNCRTGNRTGGSNPPASAVRGVNQRFTWFTPFFVPRKSLVGIFESATSMVLCFAMSI